MTLKNASFLYSPWFSPNGLFLNPEKTDAVLFGTNQYVKSLSNTSKLNVVGTSVALSNKVKLLGVTLDRHLTFDSHIMQVCRSAHFHTRALCHIWNIISNDTVKSVAQALVSSRLDYANSILFGVSKQNITKLQRSQNTLARVVMRSRRYDSATIQLQQLHWLPIKQMIDFKICVLSFKTLTTNSPAYLVTLLNSYKPGRTLRSTCPYPAINEL